MTNPSPDKPIPDYRDLPYGSRRFGKLLTFYITTRNRWRTQRTERKRIPILESIISTLQSEQLKARERGTQHIERVYNVALYLMLMDRDFAVFKLDMVSTWDKWRLRYIARQMALLLYEACDDLTQMLGKQFRDSLAALEITETEKHDFDAACKALNQFKKTHHHFLYHNVRNLVAGHRTHDSIAFLAAVESINPLTVFRINADFFTIVHQLTGCLTRIVLHIGKFPVMLRQLLESPQFLASLDSPKNG